jgi:N-methylhydantoinase B
MDAIETAIMNNRFAAIVEEASATLHRTAHTTFTKLVQDYQCSIATVDGDMFAYPIQSGVNVFMGLPIRPMIEIIGIENMRPGDCFITNDPFGTDGLVTHLMDVTTLRPIFHDDELIAFSWAFIHASDIGGAVPGSISPDFTEVFQEGLRIRPMHIFKEGKLVEEIRDIYLDNSRIPNDIWGDFQAMFSAQKSMDRRLNELCRRYGPDRVKAGMRDVIDFAEIKARQVISTIPDGEYEFGDYLEGINEGEFAFIHATLRVQGDEVEIDFTGTEPQTPSAYNYVTGSRTHPYLVQAMIHLIFTRDPECPRNAGILRPIRTCAPRGTIINAIFPAAGGSRVVANTRAYDAIIGCLNQALPGGLVAGSAGMMGIIVLSARDPVTGKKRVGVVNTICGGGGGRCDRDGVDAIDTRFSHLGSVPAEVVEAETVLIMRAYRLLPDSQAAGKWQGGAALVLELENTGHEAMMTVRGLNRFHFQPWGFDGGDPGGLGNVILNPGTPEEKSIGKIKVLQLTRGDIVRLTTPSGGGFGDPLDRDPERISSDIARGLVTRERAKGAYGVVFDANGQLDLVATEVRRSELKSQRTLPLARFTLGRERESYDQIWPTDIRKALSVKVLNEEPAIRQNLIASVRDRLTGDGVVVTPQALETVYQEELMLLVGRRRVSGNTRTPGGPMSEEI